MIVTKTVNVRLWGNQHKRLLELGYDGKYGDWIDIKVSDLLPKSDKKVIAECTMCNTEREVTFSKYTEVCDYCNKTKVMVGEKNSQWKGGHKDFCIDCSVPISRGKGYKRCEKCFGKNTSNSNHYRWREDRENIVVRNGNMQRWADSVKISADYICDFCGDKDSEKVSHHLNGVDRHREEMYNHDNGVCLCVECHKDFHGEYGYGNNTVEQYIKFKGVNHGN